MGKKHIAPSNTNGQLIMFLDGIMCAITKLLFYGNIYMAYYRIFYLFTCSHQKGSIATS